MYLSLFFYLTFLLSLHSCILAADPVQVAIPTSPPSSSNVVYNNFLGISIELSFLNQYFGNDTSSIPTPMVNYLSALRNRSGQNRPVRMRIGGNSMDSSVFVPEQSTMLQFTNPQANPNNQPVNFGPVLFDVMKNMSDKIGGGQYLIGLSLLDPNSTNMPLIAGAAQSILGDDLDAYLLGNEPDLYTNHQQRPSLKNYTVDNYLSEFSLSSSHLKNTSAGDVLSLDLLAGPTICCNWDLATLLQQGYLSDFSNILKYITLQHYPQNDCSGSYPYELPYYTQHAKVTSLAAWQKPGISLASSSSPPKQVIMSEFNSASCGGIPEISDTFAVGSLWIADYALQMASIGYSGAYIHTREPGVTYNIVDPPANGTGAWTTKPPYYGLLATGEALQADGGNIVSDLDIANSTTDVNATIAGYAIYDAQNSSVNRAVLFNYGNTSSATVSFAFPGNIFPDATKKSVTVKYLSAASLNEKTSISWGGETLSGVADGNLVSAPSSATAWAAPSKTLDCSSGCTVDVPGPALAVVFVGSDPVSSSSSPASNGGHPVSNGTLNLHLAKSKIILCLLLWWIFFDLLF